MDKEKKSKDQIIEIIVAVLLGVTALATAWASWIGSLHGGNQATNYTTSNNLSAEGNSEWNEASQMLMQDMMTWNTISDIYIDMAYAEEKGDELEYEKLSYKYDTLLYDNCTEDFQAAIEWALSQEEWTSPFEYTYEDGTTYQDSYFDNAREVIAEADQMLEQGKADNTNGDAFNLVTVIYSVVLFLLGIVGVFKNLPNRIAILGVAAVGFLIATIYMFTIPMPTGFSLMSFFRH